MSARDSLKRVGLLFNRHKKSLQWLLAILMIVLTAKLIVDGFGELRRLREFRLEHLVLLCAAFVVYLLIRSIFSLVIVNSVDGVAISFPAWLRIFVVGRFANLLFAQSGNLYRATRLKRQHNLSYTGFVNANALFVWIDSLLSLLLVFGLTLGVGSKTRIAGVNVTLAVGSLTVATAIAPFAAKRLLELFGPEAGVVGDAREQLCQLFVFVVDRGANARLIGKLVALSGLQFVVWVLLYSIAFKGIGVRANLADIAVFLAVYKLSTFLVITPGNVGIREVTYALVGRALGIGMAQGAVVAAILRAIGYAVLIPLGLVWGGADLLHRQRDATNATKH
jgi:uncharacterized membrane protein YbhN (UPF0104 family)